MLLFAMLATTCPALWAQAAPGVREAAADTARSATALADNRPEPRSADPDSLPRSDPRTVTTAVEQAARLIKERQPQAALASLENALKRHPRDPQLRFLYGVVLAEQNRADDAIGVFEQLPQDFPELPEPHNNLAVMLAGRGELDRARTALENAVRALPAYALAQENLGDVYVRMAARAYERAGQLDPRSTAARDKLALARELVSRLAPAPSAAPK